LKEICKYTFRLFLIILLEEFEDTKTKNIQSIIDLMVNDSVSINIKFYVVKAVTSEAPLTSWFTIGFLKLRSA
jgi:hypothetical protein